jgi:hypothetical protein
MKTIIVFCQNKKNLHPPYEFEACPPTIITLIKNLHAIIVRALTAWNMDYTSTESKIAHADACRN